jgi:hypothetical protein
VTGGRDGISAAYRLVGDVQRFGFLSAARVVDRYIEMVDRALGPDRSPTPDAARPVDDAVLDALLDGLARAASTGVSVLESLESFVSTVLDGAGRAVGEEAQAAVAPPAVPAGSTTEASFWLHNPGHQALTDVDLWVSPLMSGTGATIPPAAVAMSPRRVALVPGVGSEEVRLRVAVPSGQPRGAYHGLVLCSATPGEPLGVRVEVTDGQPRP